MKNLKELEQKYLELGKEIEALKNQITEEEEIKYPIYCKNKNSFFVVKFQALQIGYVVVNYKFHKVGQTYTNWIKHTDEDEWQQLDVCKETGFFDGQLVWCWDNSQTHKRELKFYDVKNKCSYDFSGGKNGYKSWQR